MKIPDSLRAAIKSYCAVNKPPGYREREENSKKAVRSFLKKNPRAGKLASAAECAFKRATDLRKQLEDDFGLHLSCSQEWSIQKEEVFAAAGGEIPELPGGMNFDLIMHRLAGASNEKGLEILREIGINWS